jgi:hypothetical protein
VKSENQWFHCLEEGLFFAKKINFKIKNINLEKKRKKQRRINE